MLDGRWRARHGDYVFDLELRDGVGPAVLVAVGKRYEFEVTFVLALAGEEIELAFVCREDRQNVEFGSATVDMARREIRVSSLRRYWAYWPPIVLVLRPV